MRYFLRSLLQIGIILNINAVRHSHIGYRRGGIGILKRHTYGYFSPVHNLTPKQYSYYFERVEKSPRSWTGMPFAKIKDF